MSVGTEGEGEGSEHSQKPSLTRPHPPRPRGLLLDAQLLIPLSLGPSLHRGMVGEQRTEQRGCDPSVLIMQPILRFLQLLCENHNRDLQVRPRPAARPRDWGPQAGPPSVLQRAMRIPPHPLQNFLRCQNNKTNYNLVCETLQFLDIMCGGTTGGLGLLGLYINEDNVGLVIQTPGDPHRNCCQGPCHGSQVSRGSRVWLPRTRARAEQAGQGADPSPWSSHGF